ncbi:MAG TPA: hypothetical protein VN840_22250 [Streptosporangiaceae bacterium]|nr:hypothetical protein [Streptosporangiaceae bacterium]
MAAIVFADLSVWYRPKDQFTSAFTYHFSHPVMQFTDTVRLHNDRQMVSFFVQNYMLRRHDDALGGHGAERGTMVRSRRSGLRRRSGWMSTPLMASRCLSRCLPR